MDIAMLKTQSAEYLRKYGYIAVIILVGLILMLLPEKEEEAAVEKQAQSQEKIEDSLASILSRIEGAGAVDVLLTQCAGEQILYQTDEHYSSDNKKLETVCITNAQREEAGLIRQVIPPVYQGAIVLCQGADKAHIRLSIVEAVKSVTGLGSDRITVLKMK